MSFYLFITILCLKMSSVYKPLMRSYCTWPGLLTVDNGKISYIRFENQNRLWKNDWQLFVLKTKIKVTILTYVFLKCKQRKTQLIHIQYTHASLYAFISFSIIIQEERASLVELWLYSLTQFCDHRNLPMVGYGRE